MTTCPCIPRALSSYRLYLPVNVPSVSDETLTALKPLYFFIAFFATAIAASSAASRTASSCSLVNGGTMQDRQHVWVFHCRIQGIKHRKMSTSHVWPKLHASQIRVHLRNNSHSVPGIKSPVAGRVMPPAGRVGLCRPLSRRGYRRLFGAGVAPSVGRGGSGDGREIRCHAGHTKKVICFKFLNETTASTD